jgi:phosphoglycolate phosphatase-like HAD superfamily hydrolase
VAIGIRRRTLLASLLAGVPSLRWSGAALAQGDPLPSWNDGAVKKSITGFVARVITPGGGDFVPLEQRIAVFDNDGTLWCEQPVYFQVVFAFDEVRRLAPQHPEWSTTQPFTAVLNQDMKTLAASGEKGIVEIITATHSGTTTDEFAAAALHWVSTSLHPRFNRPYIDIVYRSMQELLAYLRANDFKTFIVSGGGLEFMRPWTERVYGIPPERVVGSAGAVKLESEPDGKLVLMKLPQIEFIDDGPGKPVGINRFIGRRPIFVFGNSDGDRQMLEWTAAGGGACFMGVVHHTDDAREYAYDRQSHVGKLDKALDEANAEGWSVVDMKRDWNKVFSFET